MSTSLSPPASQPKISLKAPLILAAIFLAAGVAEFEWFKSKVSAAHLLFRHTENGWQQLPKLSGFPEKLRISSDGAVWLLSWGPAALHRWDGSAWHSYSANDFGAKVSYADLNFALDGDQLWAATQEGVLRWNGNQWHRYQEATPGWSASIAAGGGEVFIVDPTGSFLHFKSGQWTKQPLVLSGVKWDEDSKRQVPRLARTTDGTIWLVLQRVWRFDNDNWIPVSRQSAPLNSEFLVGATDHLWLEDESGLRAISTDAKTDTLYPASQTGTEIYEWLVDVSSDGKRTWFAADKGLIEFDGAHWRRLPSPSDLVPGTRGIAVAPDGTLWVIGSSSGSLFRGSRYLVFLSFFLPLGILGASIWFFWRLRARQLQQHQRVTQAVEHATGEVPAELEMGQRRLAGSGVVWIILIFGGTIGFIVLRRFWPHAPYWILPLAIIAIHLAITLEQSLVKRKPKPYDPIGPGAPPKYDWGKTLKSVAGGTFVIILLSAGRFPALRFLRGNMFWALLLAVVGYKALGLKLMVQAARRGNYDRSIKILRWFHFYNPSGTDVLRMIGHMLLAAGRHREAEDALRRSLASSHAVSSYSTALEDLGEVLMEQGRYDDATRSFEAALHSIPWLHRPYRGIAEMLLRQGKDTQEALRSIEKIVDFEGLSWQQRKINGRPQDDYWALKAWALARSGQGSEVAPAIENAIKATDPRCLPDLAATHYRAGMAMQALGNLSEANRHFQRAAELDPHGRRGMLAKAAMRNGGVLTPVDC